MLPERFRALLGRYHGVVESFDDPEGIGRLRLDEGGAVGFHCTQIADGSRTIAVGARISCSLVAGNLGMVEASGIVGYDS